VVVVGNGPCALLYVKDREPARIRKLVEFLQAEEWVGVLFTAGRKPPTSVEEPSDRGVCDPQGRVGGTFSLQLIHQAHPERQPDILLTFPWTSGKNEFGMSGTDLTTIRGAAASGHPGSGHGSMSPWAIRNTLIAWGTRLQAVGRRPRAGQQRGHRADDPASETARRGSRPHRPRPVRSSAGRAGRGAGPPPGSTPASPTSARAQVDRAEQAAPPVDAGGMTRWRAPLTIQAERTHGRLMWVSSSASTTAPSGRSVMAWADIGDDLLGVRGAVGDQPGSPPGGGLAYAPVQGPQAHGGAAQVQVQQPDRPRLGLGEQPAHSCAQPPATQAWPAGSGPVGQRVRTVGVVAVHPAVHRARVAPEQLGDGHGGPALLGEQDHHQPQPDPVRAVQQPEQVTGVASRAGSLGVHAGGRILARAS
jgi:hypothetical protein